MIVTKFLPMIFSLLAFNVSANAPPGFGEHALGPCINAPVSANGTCPTQATDELIDACLAWSNRNDQPDFAFTVANPRLPGTLDDR